MHVSRFNFSLLMSPMDPMPPVTCRANRKVPSCTKQAREASALSECQNIPNLHEAFWCTKTVSCRRETAVAQARIRQPHLGGGQFKYPWIFPCPLLKKTNISINHTNHSGRPSMAHSWFSRCSLVAVGECGAGFHMANAKLVANHAPKH